VWVHAGGGRERERERERGATLVVSVQQYNFRNVSASGFGLRGFDGNACVFPVGTERVGGGLPALTCVRMHGGATTVTTVHRSSTSMR
jgi:hypothetical protein